MGRPDGGRWFVVCSVCVVCVVVRPANKIPLKCELVHGQSLMRENILSKENQVMVRRLRIQFVDVVVDLIRLANP